MGEVSNIGSISRPDALCDRNRIILLEHHPQDSRIKIKEDGVCQCLATNMGLGGGNVPIIIEVTDETNHCNRYVESKND